MLSLPALRVQIPQVTRVIEEVDTNGDGVIKFDEFMDMMRQQMVAQCCLFRGAGLVSQYPPAVSQYPRQAKLWRARSRLYRSRFLQENTHLKALTEIYAMHTFV